ncbi:MAG TPA: hypothetical protein VMT15_20870 [Bryobacteraceae bacterium]|nr:hypothetical protein [Bryobacteraceae bacterium]
MLVSVGLEIVSIFLFVGGFMYLILSGQLRNMFRDRAPKPLLLIALVTGFAFYHWGTILMAPAPPEEEAAPEPRVAVPEKKPPAPVVTKRLAKPATPRPVADAPQPEEPEHWHTVIMEDGKPVVSPQAPDSEPSSAPVRSSPDPYESKAVRGIKAVGRFLHLRKREP